MKYLFLSILLPLSTLICAQSISYNKSFDFPELGYGSRFFSYQDFLLLQDSKNLYLCEFETGTGQFQVLDTFVFEANIPVNNNVGAFSEFGGVAIKNQFIFALKFYGWNLTTNNFEGGEIELLTVENKQFKKITSYLSTTNGLAFLEGVCSGTIGKNSSFLYACTRKGRVLSFKINPQDGTLSFASTFDGSNNPMGNKPPSYYQIEVSDDNRALYAGGFNNRREVMDGNGISQFSCDPETGLLTYSGTAYTWIQDTNERYPSFAIPSGQKHLYFTADATHDSYQMYNINEGDNALEGFTSINCQPSDSHSNIKKIAFIGNTKFIALCDNQTGSTMCLGTRDPETGELAFKEFYTQLLHAPALSTYHFEPISHYTGVKVYEEQNKILVIDPFNKKIHLVNVNEGSEFYVAPTSVNKMPENTAIHIFPNPAKNHIHIEHKSLAGTVISIMALSGHTVQKIVAKNNHVDINLEKLPNACYLVKLEKGGNTRVHKIIKQQ